MTDQGHLLSASDLRVVEFPSFGGHTGRVTIAQTTQVIPFQIARTFWVTDVPSGQIRGNHAHRRCNQMLVATAGRVVATCRDGLVENKFVLDGPSQGLLMPAGIWGEQLFEVSGSVLLVLCDQPYEECDYIRDWDAFLCFRGLK